MVSVKIRGSRVFADERTFVPEKSDKLFLRRGVLDECKKGGTKKIKFVFCDGFSEK